MQRRVVITGMGLVTPVGIGVEDSWSALCAGKSGITEITRFNASVYLTRIAGEPIAKFFKRRIADPNGMDPNEWRWGDLGTIDGRTIHGGSGNSNGHIFISARQMARLGLLFLNEGTWDGRRLIAAEWVRMATRPQVPASIGLWPDSAADGRGVYGFNWWANGIGVDGRRRWPGVPVGTYAASGYNNNDMFIIPEWNMVIVRLGLDQQQFAISNDIYAEFLRRVGAALDL